MAGGFPKVETWFEVLEGQCSLTSWTKPRCDSVSSPCLSGRCGGKCEWPLAVLTTPCTPPIVLAAVVIESREVSCRIRNTSMPGVSSRTSQVSLHRLRISFHLWRFSDSGNLDLPYFVLLHKSSTPCSEKKKRHTSSACFVNLAGTIACHLRKRRRPCPTLLGGVLNPQKSGESALGLVGEQQGADD